MTESLFRFLLLRPPIAQDDAIGSITLAQPTDFQKELATAAASPSDPRTALVTASKGFIASPKFISSASATPFQKQVNTLSAIFDKLDDASIFDLKAVVGAVKQVFGNDPAAVVQSADFVALVEQLKDSIVAIKYVQEEHTRPIADLIDQLRDLELIRKASKSTPPAAKSLLASPSDPQVPPPWKDDARYEANDHVVYENDVYECTTAHRSHPRLAPHDTPQLWSAVPRATALASQAVLQTLNDQLTTWKPDVNYSIGNRVLYNGIIYMCLQAHRSQVDWKPGATPALWKALEVAPLEPPKVEPPLYRRRSLLLPIEVDLKPTIAASADERKKADDDRKKAAQDAEAEALSLLKTYEELKAAIDELVKLNPDLLQVKDQPKSDPIDVDDKFGKLKIVEERQEYRRQLRDIALGKAKGQVTAQSAMAVADPPADPPKTTPAEPTGAYSLAKDLLSNAGLLNPKGPWNLIPPEERTPRLKSTAMSSLSDTTKKVLNDRKIDITKQPLNRVIKQLRLELESILSALKDLAPAGDNISYTRVGSAFITTRSPILSRVTALLYGHRVPKSVTALPVLPLDGRIPHTKGQVSSVGVADLLVVKQTLKGYEGTDVAHVENVLKGESKQRTHTETTKTETTVSVEKETTTAQEQELTSTTRYEMSKEVTNTIDEDQSLKADLKVSAKYGPAVTVDASAEGSVSRSMQAVNKAASKFSQDVTERTVKKISERVLEKRSTTTLSEIVEVNQHGINNVGGSGHISGVYQWVNKKYEAQVYNYGHRMMFEFMIPEPAAFLTYAIAQAANNAEADLLLEKPDPFTLTPSEITVESISHLTTKYQATDVLPPPEDYITVADQAKVGGGDENTNYDHGALITIPTGYEAVYATVSAVKNIWVKDDVNIDIMVGGEIMRFGSAGADTRGTSIMNHLEGATTASGGTIAWAFNTFNIPDCVVSVEILCRVTERRKQQWQDETHAKLVTAYKARLQEYEEKLSRAKINAGIAIQGTNPAANLIAIKTELKKNCISLITAQHYELFNSISTNPVLGYPEINLYEADGEGPYVRFFEQAFEWDQLMYITYSYFWGRQSTWIKKLSINDPDPVFDEFLKSGFARVVVPARPNFEGAIDHFLLFGETWNGGPLPPVTSKLYVPIADEIAERTGRPQGETPQGESWTVTLPTTLVKLRADDKLPTFPGAEP